MFATVLELEGMVGLGLYVKWVFITNTNRNRHPQLGLFSNQRPLFKSYQLRSQSRLLRGNLRFIISSYAPHHNPGMIIYKN